MATKECVTGTLQIHGLEHGGNHDGCAHEATPFVYEEQHDIRFTKRIMTLNITQNVA
jgi:hypothetical protein